ncbi:MAG: hypothetical protein J7623_12925, partial [Chitinophaga sp.]|uniref:DUF6443 domain-containing protein n=1 Tax=Chitinophaga sp. TaxID=1869181 RepID=UPI001B2EF86E
MNEICLRKILYPLLFVCGSFELHAQNIPAGIARANATPVAIPSGYTMSSINYVRSWEPSAPIADPIAVSTSSDLAAVKQSTKYFDGLGRLLQTVNKGVSPSGKDLVEPITYDAFGREIYKYLPYVPKSDNVSDGKFKTDPFAAQQAFYQDG